MGEAKGFAQNVRTIRPTWNYRVMRHVDQTGDVESVAYIMHEVHYDTAGKITGWTEDGCNVVSDTRGELFEVLACMIDAIALPVLDASTGEEVEPVEQLSDDLKRVLQRARHFEEMAAQANVPTPPVAATDNEGGER